VIELFALCAQHKPHTAQGARLAADAEHVSFYLFNDQINFRPDQRPPIVPVIRIDAVIRLIIAVIGPIVVVIESIVVVTGAIVFVVIAMISGIAATGSVIAPVVNLDKVAVACGIDLHRRSLRHGLA
jgi:hypothetical protein